jgi:hypothetical protein
MTRGRCLPYYIRIIVVVQSHTDTGLREYLYVVARGVAELNDSSRRASISRISERDKRLANYY